MQLLQVVSMGDTMGNVTIITSILCNAISRWGNIHPFLALSYFYISNTYRFVWIIILTLHCTWYRLGTRYRYISIPVPGTLVPFRYSNDAGSEARTYVIAQKRWLLECVASFSPTQVMWKLCRIIETYLLTKCSRGGSKHYVDIHSYPYSSSFNLRTECIYWLSV